MPSSLKIQALSSKSSLQESCQTLITKNEISPQNFQENSQTSQHKNQYQQYVQKKREASVKQEITPRVCLKFFKIILFGSFVIILLHFLSSLITHKKHKAYQTIQNSNQTISIRPKAFPSSSLCNQNLPYSLFEKQAFEPIYHKWYGKIGSNINQMSYGVGHFIQRHLADNGQCTYFQSAEGKTVFYDWNQVLKAYNKTSFQKCALSDPNTYSFQFQIKIASPSEYIKGIDCLTGAIKNFSKIFILYRRAIQKSNPYQDEYLASNFVTIWTFYPKN